eukprot:2738625-Ditylum_brightwellii.AAC.1
MWDLLASVIHMEFNEGVVYPDIAKSSVNKEGDKTSEEETKCFKSKDQTSLKNSGEGMTQSQQRWRWLSLQQHSMPSSLRH